MLPSIGNVSISQGATTTAPYLVLAACTTIVSSDDFIVIKGVASVANLSKYGLTIGGGVVDSPLSQGAKLSCLYGPSGSVFNDSIPKLNNNLVDCGNSPKISSGTTPKLASSQLVSVGV